MGKTAGLPERRQTACPLLRQARTKFTAEKSPPVTHRTDRSRGNSSRAICFSSRPRPRSPITWTAVSARRLAFSVSTFEGLLLTTPMPVNIRVGFLARVPCARFTRAGDTRSGAGVRRVVSLRARAGGGASSMVEHRPFKPVVLGPSPRRLTHRPLPLGGSAAHHDVAGLVSTSGSDTGQLLPWLPVETLTSPPCSATSPFTSASPSPSPPSLRARVCSACVNGSKTDSAARRLDAGPGVAHPDDRGAVRAPRRDADAPARRRELGRVLQQVAEDLREPGVVAVHHEAGPRAPRRSG